MSLRRAPAHTAVVALLAIAAMGGACRRGGPHQHPPLPSGEAEEGGPAFAPATTIVDETVPATASTATVVSARAEGHPEFDRLVIELSGEMPGYRVTWLPAPPRRCAAGDTATVPGKAWLEVRLDPAQAHDTGGKLTLEKSATRPHLPAIDAVGMTCDFEGVVSLVAGTAARRPYRVLRLLDPPRLVVDVAHAPAASTP